MLSVKGPGDIPCRRILAQFPSRAVGHLAPDALIAALTAGGGLLATRGAGAAAKSATIAAETAGVTEVQIAAARRATVAEATASGTAKTVAEAESSWLNAAARSRVPESWGPGSPTIKGVGTRWADPANQKGNGIRIDQGVPASMWPTQQVDHVIVRRNGSVIGRDGQPISGSVRDNPADAHIPLSEWQTWSQWWRP